LRWFIQHRSEFDGLTGPPVQLHIQYIHKYGKGLGKINGAPSEMKIQASGEKSSSMVFVHEVRHSSSGRVTHKGKIREKQVSPHVLHLKGLNQKRQIAVYPGGYIYLVRKAGAAVIVLAMPVIDFSRSVCYIFSV
jgi:hypothetical protein